MASGPILHNRIFTFMFLTARCLIAYSLKTGVVKISQQWARPHKVTRQELQEDYGNSIEFNHVFMDNFDMNYCPSLSVMLGFCVSRQMATCPPVSSQDPGPYTTPVRAPNNYQTPLYTRATGNSSDKNRLNLCKYCWQVSLNTHHPRHKEPCVRFLDKCNTCLYLFLSC